VSGATAGRNAARAIELVVTCEHASSAVPARYAEAFRAWSAALAGHRGHDAGSLQLAQYLARRLRAPLFAGRYSRLLVDLNRSAHNRAVLSPPARALPAAERERIMTEHYQPFRRAVRETIARKIEDGRRVLHLSVHSFTPVLAGRRREADVGLLYDPSRRFERALSLALQRSLRKLSPGLRVRRNYPYRGVTDGHTTALRKVFPVSRYAGIEIEVNQAIVDGPAEHWDRLRTDVANALRAVIL
jgi:predicted N-formylglutamate amidohydrolase